MWIVVSGHLLLWVEGKGINCAHIILFILKEGAQGQVIRRLSAGKLLSLVFFLRSQLTPPVPLFMWDIMLFHFPLVILHPWRELDS